MLYNANTYFDASKPTLASPQFDGTGNLPFEALAASERTAARERARWLSVNSSVMGNIDETIVNNTVGQGINLKPTTAHEDFNKEIDELWSWFNEEWIDYYGEKSGGDLQRALLHQRMVDGGLFVKFAKPTDKRWPFSIQLVEVDNLYEASTVRQRFGVIKDGIVMTKSGRVIGYLFERHRHPFTGETMIGASMLPKQVPNDGNIFFFRRYDTARASQKREFTEYARIVTDMKFFMAFQQATVEAAAARAKLIFAIEKEGVPRHGLSDDGVKYEYINGVYTQHLNPGEKLHAVDPAAAGTKYDEFFKNSLRVIATGRGVSYELAMRDAASANFSSIRASIIQDHKLFDQNQIHITTHYLKPVYRKFVRLTALSGRLKSVSPSKYLADERGYLKHLWIGPARSWVDPYKDIMALAKKYEMGVLTLSDIAKSEGKDIADIIEDRKREKEMLRRAGLIDEEDE